MDNQDIKDEQKTVSFLASQEQHFMETVQKNSQKGIDFLSERAGRAIGDRVAGSATKKSVRDLTREASKKAVQKATEKVSKKAATAAAKEVSKEGAKEGTSFIVSSAASGSVGTVTTVAGSAAGTAVCPIVGTAVGFAAGTFIGQMAGDATGSVLDQASAGITSREKMINGLLELNRPDGDATAPVKNMGKAAWAQLAAHIRQLGSLLKWDWRMLSVASGGTAGAAILLLLIVVLPLICIPFVLFSGESYAGGYIDNCVYYSQYEEPWADVILGTETIRSSGCGPTTLAIVYSTLTGNTLTPADAAAWVVEHEYYRSGVTWWSCFTAGVAELGLTGVNHGKDLATALECIPDGGMVVISVGTADGSGNALYRGYGHFMAIRGITSEGKLLVADPASRSNSETEWDYYTVDQILKNCWSITYTP